MRYAVAAAAALLMLLPSANAQSADVRAQLAVARQRIETTDSRATGRLVQVNADGSRTNNSFAIKAHWFPGVLRALVEIVPARTPPESASKSADKDGRVSILLEMRPNGQDTVRVFHPHQAAPVALAFDKWGESVSGTEFSYEDFLQAEFYWPGQTILKSAKLGNRDCDVLKSTPSDSDHSHYTEVQTWLDHTIGYPIYAEKTLKDGGGVKAFTSLGISKSGGVWAAREVDVKLHGHPGSSLLIIERGSTKANLTAKDFSPEQIGKFEDHP